MNAVFIFETHSLFQRANWCNSPPQRQLAFFLFEAVSALHNRRLWTPTRSEFQMFQSASSRTPRSQVKVRSEPKLPRFQRVGVWRYYLDLFQVERFPTDSLCFEYIARKEVTTSGMRLFQPACSRLPERCGVRERLSDRIQDGTSTKQGSIRTHVQSSPVLL